MRFVPIDPEETSTAEPSYTFVPVDAAEEPSTLDKIGRSVSDVAGVARDWIAGVKLDGEKGGSVLEGKTLPDPQLDPELNRQTMLKSGSPDSVMFTAGRGKQRADAMVERGKQIEQAQGKDVSLTSASGLGNLLSDIGTAIESTPSALAGTAAQLVDTSPGVKDDGLVNQLIDSARETSKANEQADGAGDYYAHDFLGLIDIKRSDIRNFPSNAAFSLASMGASILSGLGVGAITTAASLNPVAGMVAGTAAAGAAGGAMAYKLDTNAFMRNIRDSLDEASVKQRGVPLTNEEFLKIAEAPEMQTAAKDFGLRIKGSGELGSIVRSHGLHEAGWEAIGNAITLGAGKYIFKKAVEGSIIKPTLATIGDAAMEVGTETETQIGQHNAEIQAGVTDGDKRSFLSGADQLASAKEVAGPTLLLTGAMGGGATVAGRVKSKIDALSPERVVARELADQLSGGEFAPMDINLANPNPNLVNAQPTERERIQAQRVQAQQQIATAATPDEAVAAFETAVQGDAPETAIVAPSDPIPKPDSASMLERVIAGLPAVDEVAAAGVSLPQGGTDEQGINRTPTGQSSGESTNADGVHLAGAESPVLARGNVPDVASFGSADDAADAILGEGVAGQVEVIRAGNRFLVAPKTAALTEAQHLEDQQDVGKLNAAVARSGEAATVALYTPSVNDTPEVRRAAAAVQRFGAVVNTAFATRLVPVVGANGYGVQFAGRAFINVDGKWGLGDRGNSRSTGLNITELALHVTAHELTHQLEKSQDQQDRADHAALAAVVAQYRLPGVLEARTKKEDAESIRFGGTARGEKYAANEIVADVNGAMWRDPKFWGRLYEIDNGSTMRRIAYKFMQGVTKLVAVAKGMGYYDVASMVSDVGAVREAAAQVWANKAKRSGIPLSRTQANQELFDTPSQARGIYAEVAPDPRDEAKAAKWNSLTDVDKQTVTKDTMDRVFAHISKNMGLQGWKVEYSSGMFEGGVNPNAFLKAPEGATPEQLSEVARVAGHIFDQKGMVAFDEDNTTSPTQAGFVKVVLPQGMTPERIDAVRKAIATAVPQAEGDTLRDGALVFGNFSEYGPAELKVDDNQFADAIEAAVRKIAKPEEQIDVSDPVRFHSDYMQAYWDDRYIPGGSKGYLEGTRYASDTQSPDAGRDDLRRGSGSDPAWIEKIRDYAERVSSKAVDYYASRPSVRPDAGLGEQARPSIQYGKPIAGAVSAVGHHFSKQQRNPISSAFYGSGLRGLEAERLNAPENADIKPRINFYVDKGQGVYPEEGVGSVRHTVQLDNLYDATADHLGIVKNVTGATSAERASKIERGIKQAGFDGYVTDNGGNQKFAVLIGKHDIAYQRRFKSVEEFEAVDTSQIDELGAFNLDAANDEIDEALSPEDARRAKQAELDAANDLRARMVAKARARAARAKEVTLDDLKAQRLHPENAFADQLGEVAEDGNELKFVGPAVQLGGFASHGGIPAVRIYKAGDKFNVRAPGTWSITEMDQATAVKFAKHMAVARKIQDAGYDLADNYRKGTIHKLVATWQKLAGKPGMFKLNERGQSTDFKQLAEQMQAMPDYFVTTSGSKDFLRIEFHAERGDGVYSATLQSKGADGIEACTMGLQGASSLGSSFYAVAAEYARLNGKRFVSAATLSSINTARRTEQALSYALKTGDSGVVLPGIQNRVYGYNVKPKTAEDHVRNTGRLLLANLRNLVEIDPSIRRLQYEPATDRFVDAKGQDASAKVQAFLALPEARAYGVGRTTLARAVVTSQILSGTLDAEAVTQFKEPIAYSRRMEPLSEEWGEPGAVVPQLQKYLGRSVMVHEDGTPIVMYHGTAQNIEAFRAKQAGAIFLSYNPNFADDFAGASAEWMVRHYDQVLTPEQIQQATDQAVAAVMADKLTKLSERKAMASEIKSGKPTGAAQDALMEAVRQFMPSGPNILPLVVRAESPFDYRNPRHVDELMAQLDANGSWDAEEAQIKAGSWDVIETDAVQQAIHDLGHDSFFVKENGQINLAVYQPNQVKSAIGNNGNYDLADDRIAYARAIKDDYDYEAAVAAKHERIRRFHHDRAALIERIDRDADSGKEAASVLRLMAHAGFRVGGKPDLSGKHEAYGAATLKPEHVTINGSVVTFDFTGKAGVRQQHSIDDAKIATDLKKRMDRDRLFAVNDRSVRHYYDSILGGKDYKTHDFRTWLATDVARQVVQAHPTPSNEDEFKHVHDLAIQAAARKIGDTEKVTKESYVDPKIFDAIRAASGVSEGVQRGDGQAQADDTRGVAAADGRVSEPTSYARRLGPQELKYQHNYLVPEIDGAFEDGAIAHLPGIVFARDGIMRTFPAMPVRIRVGEHQRNKRDPMVRQYGLQHRIENRNENPQDRGYVTPKLDEGSAAEVERAARDITLGVLDAQTAYADSSPTKVYLHAATLNRSTVLETQLDSQGNRFWSVVTSMPSTREQMMRRYKAPTSVVGTTLNGERTQQAFDIKRGILDKLKEPGQSPVTSESYILDSDGLLFKNDLPVEAAKVAPKQLARDANGRIILNKNKVAPAYSRNFKQDTVGDRFTLPGEGAVGLARRKLQDFFLPVLQAQQALLAQGGIVGEAQDVYRAEERSHGRVEEMMKDFKRQVFEPMVAKATQAGVSMDELALFAYAMHAPERNAHIAKIDPQMPDGGSGMTNADAAAVIDGFRQEGKLPVMEDLHNDLMAITATTRRVMLEEDLITQDEFDAMENAYQHYIPLRGFADKDELDQPVRRGGRGFNIRGKETMKALGRRSRAGDLLENVVSDYERATVRGERNRVGQTFLSLVQANPDPGLWEIDATRTRKSLDRSTGKVSRDTVIDSGPDTVAIKLKGHEVYVKVHDERLLRALRLAYKDDTGAIGAFLNDTIGLYSTLLRNTLTRFNPAFAAVNAVRDFGMGSAAVVDELGFKGQAQFTKHYAGALAASFRNERGTLNQGNAEWQRWFEEYRAAGGTTGGYFARSTEDIAGDIRDLMLMHGAAPKGKIELLKAKGGYKLMKQAGHVLEVLGSTSENAARVSAYRTAREMGKSAAEAASIAKNLTTNFNRKGEYGQILNTLFVFFNAAVQGQTRVLQALANPKVQGMMAAATAAGFMMAMANAGNGGDDDDGQAYWDKIADFEKERNFIIMLPPGVKMDGAQTVGKRGRYIKIPMPYGFNFFPMLGQNMADVIRNSRDETRGITAGKAAVNLLNNVLGSFNPISMGIDFNNKDSVLMAVSPSIGDLAIQMANGVNAFGNPTSPYKAAGDTGLDSENVNPRQAGGIFHQAARGLNKITGGNAVEAGWMDVAPGTLENLWGNATGGTGRFLSDVFLNLPQKALDPQAAITARDIPILKSFYAPVDELNDASLMYERRRAISEAEATQKRYNEAGLEKAPERDFDALVALAKSSQHFTQQMGKLRKQEIRAALDESLSKAERSAQIKEVQTTRNELVKEFNAGYMEIMREKRDGGFGK